MNKRELNAGSIGGSTIEGLAIKEVKENIMRVLDRQIRSVEANIEAQVKSGGKPESIILFHERLAVYADLQIKLILHSGN